MKSLVNFIITIYCWGIILYKHPTIKSPLKKKNFHYFKLLQGMSFSLHYMYITLYQRRVSELPLHYNVFKSALVAAW